MIYLDSAATSLYRPPEVARAVSWALMSGEFLPGRSRGGIGWGAGDFWDPPVISGFFSR